MRTFKVLHEKIKMRRKVLGLSQIEAARKAKLSQTHLSRVERGIQELPEHAVFNLAFALDLRPDQIAPGLEGDFTLGNGGGIALLEGTVKDGDVYHVPGMGKLRGVKPRPDVPDGDLPHGCRIEDGRLYLPREPLNLWLSDEEMDLLDQLRSLDSDLRETLKTVASSLAALQKGRGGTS